MSKSVKRELKQYTPDFRSQAIKLAIEDGNVHKTAKNLGVPFGTLKTWVSKVKSGEWSVGADNVNSVKIERTDKAPVNKPNHISQKLHEQLSAEQKKTAELERQVRRLTMEREILKKAMAYCLDAPK